MELKTTEVIIVILVIIPLLTGCAVYLKKRISHKQVSTWACYYGHNRETLNQMEKFDLAIIEPDQDFLPPKESKTTYIAYVSLGEVGNYRSYWKDIEHKNIILWENKNWKDAFLVDIRSYVWRDIILTKIIPEIVEKGYSGLFFDTIDTPIHLEETDPMRFRGSIDAVIELITSIRKTFPQLQLYSNNGLKIVDKFASYVDGFVLESLFTTYDFTTKEYKVVEPGWRNSRIALLQNALKSVENKNVLVIDYCKSANDTLRSYSKRECKKHGFIPYNTTIDLMQLGTN